MIFRGAPMDLQGTKVPAATCLWRMRLTVAPDRPTQPAIVLCRMPWQASASTVCLIPIGVGRGIIRTINETWEKNMQLLIRNGHSTKADFGKWPPELRLWTPAIPLGIKWKSDQGKVGFHCGAVTGAFHVNFSPLEAQKFDPCWFHCLKWGVTTFFQECIWEKCILENVTVMQMLQVWPGCNGYKFKALVIMNNVYWISRRYWPEWDFIL